MNTSWTAKLCTLSAALMTIGCPQLSHGIWFENSKDTLNANDNILDDENHLKHSVK